MSDISEETMSEIEEQEKLRQKILEVAEETGFNFMVYDRKEDEELSIGVIEYAIKKGIVTVADIATAFKSQLR